MKTPPTGAMVVDPTKVAPGTYYLFTFNPDTECYSDNGTAVNRYPRLSRYQGNSGMMIGMVLLMVV